MRQMICNLLCLLSSSTFLVASASATEGVEAPITPYRPSVSNSAQLPVAGQLEMELGVLSARTDTDRRHSLPYLLKLSWSQEWGILLGGEAHVIADTTADDGVRQRDRGVGDTSLVLKRAFLVDEDTAYGLELAGKIPTASQAIGTGKRDITLNGILSKDIGTFHLDLNLNTTRLGFAEDNTSRWQTGLSSALSMSLNEQWEFTAEWAGARRPGTKAQGQVLTALTYSPNKRLTFDVGVIKGLTSSSPDWSVFAGVVFPVAKLW
ncbi:transporter [Undibacterium sp. SXout7W]|uniref:transporter n=1 Tax=Undibacterium sp. SXout7W TaxID=3413049 RepID=UPI003BF180CF